MNRKICSYCGKRKNSKSFAKNKNCKGGYDVRCKKCIKYRSKVVNTLRKTAPPKPEVCECCKKIPITLDGRKKISIVLDHDPVTDEFRGYICDKCNKALGMLGDNLEGVVNAMNYFLSRNRKNAN